MPPPPHPIRRLLPLLAALLAGCGDGEVQYEIRDVRTVASPSPAAPPGNTEQERFSGGAHGPGGPHAMGPALAASSASPRRWTFTTPDGWTELPPARMRDHGWRTADGRVECTLSLLEGAAGGLRANVDRWRKQMSLPPLDDEALAKLPTMRWLGVEARIVELDGTFVGMGGTTPVPDARLLGLVAALPSGIAFLKMTGPVAAVETERRRFLSLAASLRVVEDPSAGAHPPPSEPSSSLSWTVPEGWLRQPPRSMRVVTFSPSASPKVSVYVTALSGRAGGLRMNIDRWYGEMGLPAPTDAEVAALPRGRVLGGEGVFVDLEGTFAGMGAAPLAGARMLGMVLERERGSIFVKMTGPSAEVAAERERFRAFSESLRE